MRHALSDFGYSVGSVGLRRAPTQGSDRDTPATAVTCADCIAIPGGCILHRDTTAYSDTSADRIPCADCDALPNSEGCPYHLGYSDGYDAASRQIDRNSRGARYTGTHRFTGPARAEGRAGGDRLTGDSRAAGSSSADPSNRDTPADRIACAHNNPSHIGFTCC